MNRLSKAVCFLQTMKRRKAKGSWLFPGNCFCYDLGEKSVWLGQKSGQQKSYHTPRDHQVTRTHVLLLELGAGFLNNYDPEPLLKLLSDGIEWFGVRPALAGNIHQTSKPTRSRDCCHQESPLLPHMHTELAHFPAK